MTPVYNLRARTVPHGGAVGCWLVQLQLRDRGDKWKMSRLQAFHSGNPINLMGASPPR